MNGAGAAQWAHPGSREQLLAALEADLDAAPDLADSLALLPRPMRAGRPPAAPADAPAPRRYGVPVHLRRARGTGGSRFAGIKPHGSLQAAALPPGHAALRDARTLFPSRVVAPADAPRLLVGGHNSCKIGATVRRGAWRGLPIFTLTLEERATCPPSCGLWSACFGNAMPWARRHGHGSALVARLGDELRALAERRPRGFAVRLHVLGDFYSPEYVQAWLGWMEQLPGLHVFGFTAHPADGVIGAALLGAAARWPDRWAIRFSVAPGAPQAPLQATTIWRRPETPRVPEGLVCPAQTGRTQACATCALCWAPAAQASRIVFIGHGKNARGKAA